MRPRVLLALLPVLLALAPAQGDIGRAVVEEINLARTSPGTYAALLEDLLPYYSGNDFQRPGEITIRTKEGAAAVREAIRALRAQAPLSALSWSDELSRAARDHARDQGRTGQTGHTGSDGSGMRARIERYARWGVTISENIEYGSVAARQVVIALIVDDGVGNRGHRTNIFNPAIRFAGAACGPHALYRTTCVIDHAGDISPADASRSTPLRLDRPAGEPPRLRPALSRSARVSLY